MNGNSSFLIRAMRIPLSFLVAISIWVSIWGVSASNAATQEPSSPVILSSSSNDWTQFEKSSLGSLLLWARIPSTQKDETVFSEVFRRLPNHFANLQLSVLSRGLHSSILYLEGMSLEQLREMSAFFQGLDSATLAKYDLLRPVTFFDSSKIEFELTGTQSRFLALKPHPEFVAWQVRFWKMVSEVGPSWLIEHHKAHRDLGEKAVSESSVHSSLVQWSGRSGIELSDEQVENLKKEMREVFEESINALRDPFTGEPPAPIQFDWTQMPLMVSQPSATFTAGPFDVLSLKATPEGKISVSQVVRIRIPTGQEGQTKVIEARIDEFLAKKAPQAPESMPNYLPEKKVWVKMEDTAFFDYIEDSRIRDAYLKAKAALSPSWAPAAVPTLDFKRANQFFISTQTHPQLDPAKTFDSLEMLREIGFHSLPDISIGMSVYASSARKEIRNPSDVDLMINALAWVPKSVSSYEEAKSAAGISVRRLLEQIRDLDREGKIAIAELRIGSDATMGYLSGDPIQDSLNNPYLSREDIHQGFHVDRFGKKWTLEELIALGDFTKFKIDFFKGGRRYPISLQIGYGFNWRDHVYHFNQNGGKGVQPNLRTAVYDGAESFAIAMALARPYSYYMVQKFPTMARAIGELRQTAKIENEKSLLHWSPKFIKKFYNFLFLAQSNELRMDEIFYQETVRSLSEQGVSVPSLNEIIDDLLRSINTPELATLNALKRNLNDFREFNEFQHHFTKMQWTTRVDETRQLLEELKTLLALKQLKVSREFRRELETKTRKFVDALNYLSSQSPEKAVELILQKRFHPTFYELEKILGNLESHIVANGSMDGALHDDTKRFIETFVRELPRNYYRYLVLRSQDAPQRMKWTLKLMGYDPADQKMSDQPVVVKKIQPALVKPFIGKGGPCEGVFFDRLRGHAFAW